MKKRLTTMTNVNQVIQSYNPQPKTLNMPSTPTALKLNPQTEIRPLAWQMRPISARKGGEAVGFPFWTRKRPWRSASGRLVQHLRELRSTSGQIGIIWAFQ